MKKALVTGISGQDGSYLAEFLLSMGYEVHGLVRRSSTLTRQRLDHLQGKRGFKLHYGDLGDPVSLHTLIHRLVPNEIYNLAAQSHVRVSFDQPFYTGQVTGLGSTAILEAVRSAAPEARFYQASSSEMFGATPPPQDEQSLFHPRSPYGVAKLYSHWMTKNYREAYGLFMVSGILFNHESPRRGENFVTRKIAKAAASIQRGTQETVSLGNLDAKRDWGYAPEFVVGMWKMLQADHPKDFVLATGQSITVREFLAAAFSEVGKNWESHLHTDGELFRPTEVDFLKGHPRQAWDKLNWRARLAGSELAKLMVRHEIDALNAPGGFLVDRVDWDDVANSVTI